MARKTTQTRTAVVTVAAWTIGLLIFFPILWIIILGFKSEGDAIKTPLAVLTSDWTLASYHEVQERSNYFLHFMNSVILSLGSTLLALVIAIPAAWSMAFVPGKRTKDLLMWMLSTKMMPAVGVLVPMYLMFRDFGLLDTRIGLVVVLTLINLPIVIWMLYTYFKEIPGEILEAARMDGAGLRAEILHVLTPMAVPGIASTVLLNVILAWNEAFWTLQLTTSSAAPLTQFIASYSSPEGLFYAKLSAASTMAIAPILILGWFSQKQLAALHAQLQKLKASRSPFAHPEAIDKNPHWVKPQLIAEVSFAEWTQEGRIRHAVFKGLRSDKPPRDIRQEKPQPMRKKTSSATASSATHAAQSANSDAPAKSSSAPVGSVRVSSADRVIDPTTGLTKMDLVRYYATVAPLLMPHLKARPTSLVRAPEGVEGELFFQKHWDVGRVKGVQGIRELAQALYPAHPPLLEVASPEGLLSAAQMNTVEFHTWNARKDRIDRPDRMTFDLDPGEGVAWEQVQEAAELVHVLLKELGLPVRQQTGIDVYFRNRVVGEYRADLLIPGRVIIEIKSSIIHA